MDITPLQCRSPVTENGVQDAAEKALVDLVIVRQMEVERLERELDTLRTHCSFLFDCFSVPTYPPLHQDPIFETSEVPVVLSEYSSESDVSKAGNENDALRSSHIPGGLNQHQPPLGRDEVGFVGEADKMEEAALRSPARNPVPTEILSSSTSVSNSEGARNVMGWSRDDDVVLLKDEIRRERPWREAPAKPNGSSVKISEKELETGTSSNDNDGFADEESASEEDSGSNYEVSASEEDSGSESEESASEEHSAKKSEELASEERSAKKPEESASKEDSGSKSEESVSEEHSAKESEESASEEPSAKKSEELASEERSAKKPEESASKEDSGSKSEESVSEEHSAKESEESASEEPSAKKSEELASEERSAKKPEESASKEDSGSKSEESVSEEHSAKESEESASEQDSGSKSEESASVEPSAKKSEELASEERSAKKPEESASKEDSGSKSGESASEEPSAKNSEESASEEHSAKNSEESSSESDGIKLDSRSKSRTAKFSYSKPEEIISPSSSASECLTKKKSSPMKIESTLPREIAKTSWKPKAKAPSSSSDDSDESSSSSDDDTARNGWHAQGGRTYFGRAREFTVPKTVSTLSLSSDASPEELFDWMILGLQGPWLPLTSGGNSSEISGLKDQLLPPLKFPSMAAYVTTFQMLIGEEARAILLSEWEQYKAADDSSSMSATQSSLEYSAEDSRALSSLWQLRSMVQSMGDPFHYFEAEWKAGLKVKFHAGEFLCMVVPGTKEVKAVAIINDHDRCRAPLLRTRAPWNSSFGTCALMRLCNMVTLRRMFLAVSTISEIFSPLQQQILDPVANIKFLSHQPALEDAADGDVKLKLSSESLRNFCNRNILNSLQLLTVSCLLQMRQGFQLVQGPPGTGKTSTIVGMVSALLIEEPGVRILVCAPSNAALDEVAARLLHRMLDKAGNIYSPLDGAIVRFGSKRVMHPLVQLVSLDDLTLRLSSNSHYSRSWVDILEGASVVCATLSACGSATFDELKRRFDVVIIDEAVQAVEAEVLIALKRVRGRCVMVGDPQQLPATVFQRPSTAYGRSLFERFQEGGVPVYMLTNQYRMHPSISLYPSQQFYGGALKDSGRTCSMQSIFSGKVCEEGVNIRGCRFKLGHYCFMDVGWGTEREELIGHSRANYEEALVVCNVVEGILKGLLPDLKPNVGVITPYIAQRGVIEDQLGRRGIDTTTACEVNTVDGFQGREKDVIVLSCVRAMADRGLGFVSDEKRMNVALTRAKYSLIIIGHAETLQKWSPTWGSLIDNARKRGCYQVLRNNKNQDISSRNWNQRHAPRKDLHGAVVVKNRSQPHSRKRSLNCTEAERPHKKLRYSKPIRADTKRKR